MKKNLVKLSFILSMVMGTTLTLSSCGGEKAEEATEQEGEKKCEEGKKCEGDKKCEGEKKCEGDHKCEAGKCEGGDSTKAE